MIGTSLMKEVSLIQLQKLTAINVLKVLYILN